MSEQQASSGAGSPTNGKTSAGSARAIDIEKLAEKVYQLMRQEARLTRARGQTRDTRR